ncbi:MAG: hypothetical protein HY821_10870 [Acidobacteria bacterium]|nr:hypothetical protein [Acidobacteriota bacterium]
MRRVGILMVLAAAALWAQESHEPKAAGHEATGHEAAGHEGGDPFLPAKWVNFGILAAGLGYAAIKFGGPALKAQQQGIVDQLGSAAKRAEEAAAEAAEIERKVSNLDAEVELVRQKAAGEMDSEAKRIAGETAQLLEKVQATAEQEIVSAEKHALQQIKAAATELALELALKKLKSQVTPERQSALVAQFTTRLGEKQ